MLLKKLIPLFFIGLLFTPNSGYATGAGDHKFGDIELGLSGSQRSLVSMPAAAPEEKVEKGTSSPAIAKQQPSTLQRLLCHYVDKPRNPRGTFAITLPFGGMLTLENFVNGSRSNTGAGGQVIAALCFCDVFGNELSRLSPGIGVELLVARLFAVVASFALASYESDLRPLFLAFGVMQLLIGLDEGCEWYRSFRQTAKK